MRASLVTSLYLISSVSLTLSLSLHHSLVEYGIRVSVFFVPKLIFVGISDLVTHTGI